MLIYEQANKRIELKPSPAAEYFIDPNKFIPNIKTGRFNIVQPPLMDGVNTYDATLSNIQCRFDALAILYNRKPAAPIERQLETVRSELCAIFNPIEEGILYWTPSSGNAYRLQRVRAMAAPVFGEYISGTMPFTVELMSDYSFWEDREPIKMAMGMTVGGLRFPIHFPLRFGRYFGETIRIYNDTPYKIYPKLTFYQNNAGFKIENETTGDYMQIEKQLNFGEKMEVETAPQWAEAVIYQRAIEGWQIKEDASAWITAESGNLTIIPGLNVLRLLEGRPGTDPSVVIEWRRPYMGV